MMGNSLQNVFIPVDNITIFFFMMATSLFEEMKTVLSVSVSNSANFSCQTGFLLLIFEKFYRLSLSDDM